MSIKIEMPRLADTILECTVSRWLKQVGDSVKAGDHVADLSTEHASMELLVADDGVLSELSVPEGGKVSVGQQLAMLEETHAPASGSVGPKRVSPLAAAMARKLGLDCSTLEGSGPRGKVMAADVAQAQQAGKPAATLPIARKADVNLRVSFVIVRMDGYYVYSFPADMSQLAAISMPIAVQSEHILGSRYSLFDYVARATVRACLSRPGWIESPIDLQMILDKGNREISVRDAANKTIYHIARVRIGAETSESPAEEASHSDIVLSDAGLPVPELRKKLAARPAAFIALGGTRPKTGFEAGKPVNKLLLPVTLYVDSSLLQQEEAAAVAAEFKTLMENPVVLLF